MPAVSIDVTASTTATRAEHVCTTRPVIVLAAHICQNYNIDDEPELLADILMSVFLCDGGFDRFVIFLDPLTFPFDVDPIIYPFQSMHTFGTIYQRYLKVLEYTFVASNSHHCAG